jgi:hypothetical protein
VNVAVQIGQTFAAHPPAVAAALVGAREVFRLSVQILPKTDRLAALALRGRLNEKAMVVSETQLQAFADCLGPEVTLGITDHAPEILAWQNYLSRVGDLKPRPSLFQSPAGTVWLKN